MPDGRAVTTVVQALTGVMSDVKAVRKDSFNEQGRFHFRGIDAVVNAVQPALIKHGVVIAPKVLTYEHGSVVVGKNRTEMSHATMTVRFTFYGPEGDSIEAETAAEAMDSGDKSTSKAHSVAMRTALLQVLMLPTDDVDPDAQAFERTQRDAVTVKQRLATIAKGRTEGDPVEWLAGDFSEWSQGGDLRTADVATLTEYAEHLSPTPRTRVARSSTEDKS